MISCEIIKPYAYIPSVPMTVDLQRELLLLAPAKVSPSYTHLLASHEASFPPTAKVLYFIMQDSSSSEMCPTLSGGSGYCHIWDIDRYVVIKELSSGWGEEIRELRIRIGVIFQKTDHLVEDKGGREMTLEKKNHQILNYLQLSLIEKKALSSVISGE